MGYHNFDIQRKHALDWRVHLYVLLGFLAVSVLMTWPLAADIGNALPTGSDPPRHTHHLAWIIHQLLADPQNLFNKNIFYPYLNTLAFDDVMLIQSVTVMPIVLFTGNPVLGYNLVTYSSFVFSAYAMFLLAYHLSGEPVAAWVAGLLWAFSSFRFAHFGHMNLLAMQWTPLLLIALHRVLYSTRYKYIVLTAVFGTLLVLSTLYYAYIVLIAAAVYVIVTLLGSGRFSDIKIWLRLGIAAVLILIGVSPIAVPYLRTVSDLDLVRDVNMIEALSATLSSYLSALDQNWLYGELLARFGHQGNYQLEHVLFPGIAAVVLALYGFTAWRSNQFRAFAAIAIASFILTLGPRLYISPAVRIDLPLSLPYGWLYDWLPGFASLRAAVRFDMTLTLAMSILAAFGLTQLLRNLSTPFKIGVGALVTTLILIESVALPMPMTAIETGARVPQVYQWLATQPSNTPIAELPIGDGRERSRRLARYQYFSSYHWQPMVTSGYPAYSPGEYGSVYSVIDTFPSAAALRLLSEFNVRYLIVHLDEMPKRDQSAFRARLRDMNIEPVKEFGGDQVFLIPPTEQALEKIRVKVIVPSPQSLNAPVTAYLLLMNGSEELVFFNPTRRVSITVNETDRMEVKLPVLTEPGTTILPISLSTREPTLRLAPGADSFLTFAPTTTTVQFDPVRSARPVALQLVDHQITQSQGSDTVLVSLQWRVQSRVREQYHIEVSLRDGQQKERGYSESVRMPDRNSSVRWRPGEILSDQVSVTVAHDAPRPLSVVIRLREEATNTLLLPLSEDAIPQNEIVLGLPE